MPSATSILCVQSGPGLRRVIEKSITEGGTLASFERAWPAMFLDAWRSGEWRPYTLVLSDRDGILQPLAHG